eukprot:TRINITY_DN26661_c0_g2_i2.p1 TRINITY_DN26661_c0_g2~~TRINITY_DN26661_c0_g2_i2.p1  ORF type:complete len:1207 (+),score=221.88 TRINITY_DN26661_c0_g2_i2:102-3722(+)
MGKKPLCAVPVEKRERTVQAPGKRVSPNMVVAKPAAMKCSADGNRAMRSGSTSQRADGTTPEKLHSSSLVSTDASIACDERKEVSCASNGGKSMKMRVSKLSKLTPEPKAATEACHAADDKVADTVSAQMHVPPATPEAKRRRAQASSRVLVGKDQEVTAVDEPKQHQSLRVAESPTSTSRRVPACVSVSPGSMQLPSSPTSSSPDISSRAPPVLSSVDSLDSTKIIEGVSALSALRKVGSELSVTDAVLESVPVIAPGGEEALSVRGTAEALAIAAAASEAVVPTAISTVTPSTTTPSDAAAARDSSDVAVDRRFVSAAEQGAEKLSVSVTPSNQTQGQAVHFPPAPISGNTVTSTLSPAPALQLLCGALGRLQQVLGVAMTQTHGASSGTKARASCSIALDAIVLAHHVVRAAMPSFDKRQPKSTSVLPNHQVLPPVTHSEAAVLLASVPSLLDFASSVVGAAGDGQLLRLLEQRQADDGFVREQVMAHTSGDVCSDLQVLVGAAERGVYLSETLLRAKMLKEWTALVATVRADAALTADNVSKCIAVGMAARATATATMALAAAQEHGGNGLKTSTDPSESAAVGQAESISGATTMLLSTSTAAFALPTGAALQLVESVLSLPWVSVGAVTLQQAASALEVKKSTGSSRSETSSADVGAAGSSTILGAGVVADITAESVAVADSPGACPWIGLQLRALVMVRRLLEIVERGSVTPGVDGGNGSSGEDGALTSGGAAIGVHGGRGGVSSQSNVALGGEVAAAAAAAVAIATAVSLAWRGKEIRCRVAEDSDVLLQDKPELRALLSRLADRRLREHAFAALRNDARSARCKTSSSDEDALSAIWDMLAKALTVVEGGATSDEVANSAVAAAAAASTEGSTSAQAVQSVSSAVTGPSLQFAHGLVGAGSCGCVGLSAGDWTRLEEGHHLNDALLDFFISLLCRTFGGPRVHSFSSQFFSRLTSCDARDGKDGWQHVRTWTRGARRAAPAGIFACDFLILPIHHAAQRHWSLAIVCRPWAATDSAVGAAGMVGAGGPGGVLRGVRIAFLDSLGRNEACESNVLHFMKGYLAREWADCAGPCAGGFDPERVEAVHVASPGQDNDWDCGVYVLEFVLQLLRQPELLQRLCGGVLSSAAVGGTPVSVVGASGANVDTGVTAAVPLLDVQPAARKRWRSAGAVLRETGKAVPTPRSSRCAWLDILLGGDVG